MTQFTEEEKTIRRIERRFNKGVVQYGLIEEGDKILIGLSGGKDSLALVELLGKRARIYKPRFSVIAVHVVMKNIPYQSDIEYLKTYCESFGVPFVQYETSFDPATDTRKSPCFLCSWNRRKALFTVAKEQVKEPFSAFINQLAHPSGVMICPNTLKLSKKEIAFNPCGTGPYVIEKYNPAEYLVVKKNPNYWQKGLPKLDGISFRPVLEDATRVAMLRTGEAQFVDVVPPEQVSRLKETPNVVIDAAPSIVQRQIYLNNTKKPFNDVRVRQALNYGIDKHAMIKVLFKGYATPATGVAPNGIDYAKQFGEWPYDPKKAKELLAAAGYPNGFTATLWAASNSSANQKMLQFLQQQYARIGVKLQVRALETGQRVSLVQSVGPEKSTSQMFCWGWSSSTGELDWVMRPLLATSSFPPSNSNYAYYSNEKLDGLLTAALKTTDRAEKTKIYDEAQELVWNDAPWVFLVADQNIAAYSKNLTGFYTLKDGGFDFLEAELK